MNEIEEANRMNQSIGDATKKVYVYNYRRLMKLTNDEPVLNMSEDRLIKTINQEGIPPQSKNALLSVVINIRKSKGLTNDKIVKFRETTLFKEKLAYKEKKNTILVNELPSFNDIETYTKSLYKEKKYVAYIVNFLMLRYGLRNKDLNLVITNNKDVISKGHKSQVNYLYVTHKYIHYVRNDYKTHSTYGQQKHRIEKSHFTKAVKEVLGDEYEKPLLKLPDGDAVSEDSVSKIIQRFTYNNLGEGKYFKIQIQELKKQGNIRRIRELSKSRGTDLTTLFQEYDIKH